MSVNLTASASTLMSSRLFEASRSRFTGAATRLSSGLRVFSAAQDAAGLFVGTKLRMQAVGWQRAQKNIQDGLSAGYVADGALAQLSAQVQRIRELSIQAANGVWTSADRAVMQKEVVQLREEIDRVVQSTSFNGTLLLTGTEVTPAATVDADALTSVVAGSGLGTNKTQSGTFAVDVVAPGQVAELVGDRVVGPAFPDAIQVTVLSGGVTSTQAFAAGQSAADVAAWIDGLPGLDAALETYYGPPDNFLVVRSTGIGSTNSFSISALPLGTAAPIDYIGFGSPAATGTGVDPVITVDGLPTSISATATTMTVTAFGAGQDADGVSFVLDNTALAALYTTGAGGPAGNVTATASPQVITDLEVDVQAGPDWGTPNTVTLVIEPMNIGAVSLSDASTANRLGTVDITTQSGAGAALAIADAAIEQIAGAQSRLGAGLGQLNQALSLATVEDEEATAARSHIMDADVAKDSAVLVQEQIRSEANLAAQAHEHSHSTFLVKLLTESEMAVPTGIESSSGGALPGASGGSGSPLGVSSGSGSPLGVSSGSGSPLGVTSAAGSPIGFSTGSGTPGGASILTGSYTPTPVTPGFQPLPVIGSRDPADLNSLLSSQSMMAMIAGSLQ